MNFICADVSLEYDYVTKEESIGYLISSSIGVCGDASHFKVSSKLGMKERMNKSAGAILERKRAVKITSVLRTM